MKNETFTSLPAEERLVKLITALRNRTENALTEAEINAIIHCVRLDRQYFICVHHNLETLFADLMRLDQLHTHFLVGCRLATQENLQQLLNEAAGSDTAVMAVAQHTNGRSGIYIFLPASRIQEGRIAHEG